MNASIAKAIGPASDPLEIKVLTKVLYAKLYHGYWIDITHKKWNSPFPDNKKHLQVCPVKYLTSRYGKKYLIQDKRHQQSGF